MKFAVLHRIEPFPRWSGTVRPGSLCSPLAIHPSGPRRGVGDSQMRKFQDFDLDRPTAGRVIAFASSTHSARKRQSSKSWLHRLDSQQFHSSTVDSLPAQVPVEFQINRFLRSRIPRLLFPRPQPECLQRSVPSLAHFRVSGVKQTVRLSVGHHRSSSSGEEHSVQCIRLLGRKQRDSPPFPLGLATEPHTTRHDISRPRADREKRETEKRV